MGLYFQWVNSRHVRVALDQVRLAHQMCRAKTASNMARCCLQSHPKLVAGVAELAQRVQADKQLAALVRRKFAIKCTTGYSLNALVDFPTSDPVEIIKRLLIGSEGTLGFVSQATYNTVPEWPHKVRRLLGSMLL